MILLLLLLCMTAFSYVGLLSLFWVWPFHAVFLRHLFSGVVFWAVCRARIRSLDSFFISGLFFRLPVFSVYVLNNLQGRFHILSSFRGVVFRPFCLCWFCWFQLFWGLIFLIFLRDFSCVFYRGFLPSGSVLSSRAALSSENACHQFLCRWHVTATLTGWFHP